MPERKRFFSIDVFSYGEVDVDVDTHASNAWVRCVFGNVDIKLHGLDLAFDFSKITVRV